MKPFRSIFTAAVGYAVLVGAAPTSSSNSNNSNLATRPQPPSDCNRNTSGAAVSYITHPQKSFNRVIQNLEEGTKMHLEQAEANEREAHRINRLGNAMEGRKVEGDVGSSRLGRVIRDMEEETKRKIQDAKAQEQQAYILHQQADEMEQARLLRVAKGNAGNNQASSSQHGRSK